MDDLRDEIAIEAMKSLIVEHMRDRRGRIDAHVLSVESYRIADSMCEARKGRSTPDDFPVSGLDISVRAKKFLTLNGLSSVQEISRLGSLEAFRDLVRNSPNAGSTTEREVLKAISLHGVEWAQ